MYRSIYLRRKRYEPLLWNDVQNRHLSASHRDQASHHTQADLRPFDAAFRAIKEALITEATEELELVNREISGNLRSVVVGDESTGQTTRYMDLYLFDNASVVQVWFVKSRVRISRTF